MPLPGHVATAHHAAAVATGTYLLVGPQLGWTPWMLDSLWFTCGIGVGLMLLQLLKNLPLLALFISLAIGSIFFPPLSIVLTLVVIYLVLSRLDYLLTHLPIVGGGFAFYATCWVFDQRFGWAVHTGHRHTLELVGLDVMGSVAVASLLTAAVLDRVLRLAYARGYTPWQVTMIGLTAPAVVLLLVLAVVGIGADVVPDIAPDLAPDLAPDVAPEGAPLITSHEGHGSELVEVSSYVRSNPDGIPENNLSYEGPRPAGTPETPGTHVVAAHVRTAPDGILENNLSYQDVAEPQPGSNAVRSTGSEAAVGPRIPAEASAAGLTSKKRPR